MKKTLNRALTMNIAKKERQQQCHVSKKLVAFNLKLTISPHFTHILIICN